MAMNLTQWQEKSDKILGLLQSDAANRQQALMLLDAIAESIAADGAGSAFASIFAQPNTINATFGWMQEILDGLYWTARGEFEDERIFWPLYDIMLRISPDRAMNLPPTLALGKCNQIPEFLSQPNSIRHLVIVEGDMSLSRLHKLNGVVSVSFNISSGTFQSLDWSQLNFGALEKGQGEFRILGPERNALVFDEVNGERSLRVATGIFMEQAEYSFNTHTSLQVADATLSQICKLWTHRTPHEFLDLGLVHLHLSGDVDLTIAERLTSIHLQTIVAGWGKPEHVLEQLFEGNQFPLLTSITSQLCWEYQGRRRLVISADMLRNMPSLQTVYLHVSTEEWGVTFKDCEALVHPLSTVVVSEEEQLTFFIFDDSNENSLQSRLKAISVGCDGADFLVGETSDQKSFLSGASDVHLFYTEGLSMIRHFTQLEHFQVERDPYLVHQKLTKLQTPHAASVALNMGDIPSNIEDLTKRVNTPSNNVSSGVLVSSMADLQFYYGGKEPYIIGSDFLVKLRRCCAEQSFPKSFVSWVESKGMVRVGRNCLWVNDAGVVRMKAYATWGSIYLNHVKTYGGPLNLERVLFGLPQGVSNLLPLSMKSIRYNDPAIPVAGLLTISSLVELRVEIPVDVEDICNLHNLEVLYLNDLGLTTLPDTIGDLKSLRELHLWGNELKTLPDSVRKLKNLRLLNISGNNFETVPKVVLSLPNLQRFIWRGGTEEWEQALDGNSSAAKRVEDGEMTFYDADYAGI